MSCLKVMGFTFASASYPDLVNYNERGKPQIRYPEEMLLLFHQSDWAGLFWHTASVISISAKLRRYLASLKEWQRNFVTLWPLQSTSRTLMIQHKLLGALTVLHSSFLTSVEYLTPQRVWNKLSSGNS